MYASFTVDYYGKATVVFDGYIGRPRTKYSAHQHRCPQVTNKVDISIATQFIGKKRISLQITLTKRHSLNLVQTACNRKAAT